MSEMDRISIKIRTYCFSVAAGWNSDGEKRYQTDWLEFINIDEVQYYKAMINAFIIKCTYPLIITFEYVNLDDSKERYMECELLGGDVVMCLEQIWHRCKFGIKGE